MNFAELRHLSKHKLQEHIELVKQNHILKQQPKFAPTPIDKHAPSSHKYIRLYASYHSYIKALEQKFTRLSIYLNMHA